MLPNVKSTECGECESEVWVMPDDEVDLYFGYCIECDHLVLRADEELKL